MDFNVTKEQWVDRFVQRLGNLERGGEPDDFLRTAERLWSSRGQIAAEAAADAEFAARAADRGEPAFERTERQPVERVAAADGYVRDDGEWIARCLARVIKLDPVIKADEARRSVGDLAALERWRSMKPEAAAEQLYTPIKPKAG